MIVAFDERLEISKAISKTPADFNRLRALQPEMLWDGDATLGARLQLLAEQYHPISNDRADARPEMVLTYDKRGQKLWKDLAPYRRALPPVRVVIVSYPGSEQVVVEPKTILLAVGAWEVTPDGLADAILQGMHSLSARGRSWPLAA